MSYWRLCCYFAAFNANILALIVAQYFFGLGSVYAWVYVLTSVPIFLAIGAIVMESLHTREHRARALACGAVLAISLGHVAHVGIVRPITAYDWIMLTEGTLLVWAGTVLGFAAVHLEQKDLALIFSLLWLAQALFSFGFVIQFRWQFWQDLNFWLPEAICIAGFSTFWYRLKRGKNVFYYSS